MHRRSEASAVGDLGTKEREIEPGSKQAAGGDEAERGEQPPAIAAPAMRLAVRVARGRAGNHTPPFQGVFIRVPLLLYIAHAPRGLVREHDEGEREEQADESHYSIGAVAARHGRPQRTAPAGDDPVWPSNLPCGPGGSGYSTSGAATSLVQNIS